jgi:hypothetical protein
VASGDVPFLFSPRGYRIPVVEAIAKAVRGYGTGSARPAPEDQPFVAESFPQPGDRCSVFLGPIPSSIEGELRQRNAFLEAAVKHVFMGGDQLDRAIPAILAERREQPVLPTQHAWHVTYVFERPVDLPANPHAAPNSPYQWLDLSACRNVDTKLRQEANDAFDALLAYTVGVITPTYFDDVALPLAMYYVADEVRFALVPQFYGGGKADISHSSPFPSEALRNRVDMLGRKDWESHAWLKRVWSWHGLALTEPPGWRLFMAAWTGLEVLARRAGREALPEHRDRTGVPRAMKEQMKRAQARNPPLAADFAALVLEFSPASAERDYERFVAIKAVRDALLHGEPLDEESLPAQDARALLGEYVEKATVRFIHS